MSSDTPLVPVESSRLSPVEHHPTTCELEAVFADGVVWRYSDLPEDAYRALLATNSIGSYMRNFVIDMYPDCRIRRRQE